MTLPLLDHQRPATKSTPANSANSATPANPATPPTETPSRRAWHAGQPVLLVYIAAAVLHIALLAAMIPAGGPGIADRLQAWDGQRYVEIAAHGYPSGFTYTADGQIWGNNLAFFPLFPLLIRAVHTVTDLSWEGAAIVVSQLSMITALLAVHRLLTRLYNRRTATMGIVLLAMAQPMSLAFFMAYSESLFLALAAGTLLAAERRAWLTAGLLACLTGLTRPAGVAATVALAVAASLYLYRRRKAEWRPAAGVVIGSLGMPVYLLWVANRAGTPGAWFTIQQAWGTRWDWGSSFLKYLAQSLTTGDGWVQVSVALLLLAHLAVTILACCRRTWPPLLAYGAVIMILTLGQSNYYHSKPRLLIPALVFLIPMADALARARPASRAVAIACAALFGCWYGSYMLTVWSYAI
ncbi:hypothetical protein ABH926_006237 [Catenulispora sp. GP43]|uniref:hypothetical protein n=1 Tax=Catenulispora sp. GP43 TaxID=3156263 RepID=UPI003519CDBC